VIVGPRLADYGRNFVELTGGNQRNYLVSVRAISEGTLRAGMMWGLDRLRRGSPEDAFRNWCDWQGHWTDGW